MKLSTSFKLGKEPFRPDSLLWGWTCILLLGLLVYGHTLHVPWYFDDLGNIVENPLIRDLGQATRQLLAPGRGLAQWTFALNYRFGGLALPGYHLVNIAIHLTTAGIVLLILRRLFAPTSWLPLLGALLFLVHPLQTQAVTYVVQRMTSLSGLGFFLSLYLYLRAKEELAAGGERFGRRHLLFYLGAVLSGALAVLVKQNAAILPLALLLFDSYFLPPPGKDGGKERLLYLLPFCLVPLGLTVNQLLLPLLHGSELANLGTVQRLMSNQAHVTPLTYLATEFSVIWLYIRLLVLPLHQALDYSYPVVTSWFNAKSLLALLGIVGLLGGAIHWRKPAPLISGGILWFFLCLSVESSFIPLDPVFEHRLYVPLFGFVLVVIGLLQTLPQPRWAEYALLILLPVLALLAWQRNALWNDPIAFYESNLRRAPWSEWVAVDLANHYIEAERYDEALPLLRRAEQINPGYSAVYGGLALVYLAKQQYPLALGAMQKKMQLAPGDKRLYMDMAATYEKLGQPALASSCFQRAIALDPAYAPAYLYLGALQAENGQPQQAIANYEKAIALDEASPAAHYNLGVVLSRQHLLPRAQAEFRRAVQLDPSEPDALFSLAMVSLDLGDWQPALDALPRLRQLKPELAQQLQTRLSSPR